MIYVFKTTIPDYGIVEQLKVELTPLLGNSSWSFDLEDCDRIFRIETDNLEHVTLSTQFITHMGFDCVELEDLVLPVNSRLCDAMNP